MPMNLPQFGTVPESFAAMPAPQPQAPAPMPMPQQPAQPAMPMAPQAPAFQSAPMPQQPQKPGWSQMLTMLPALLAGIKNPVEVGSALAGWQRGQDRQRERMLSEQDKQATRAQAAARFYSDAITHAQQFDDEIALQQYLQAVQPMADYYGVSLSGLTISDEKKSKKDRGQVQEAIDRAVRLHGPEILNNDQASIQLADGRTFSMPVARQMVGGGVAVGGKMLPVAGPQFKADNPNELKIRAFAQRVGKKPEDLTEVEIQEAIDAGVTKPETRSLQLQANDALKRGDTEEYQRLLRVIKETGQADDRPVVVNTGPQDGRRFSQEERLAAAWTKANAPVKEMDRQLRIMEVGLRRFRGVDSQGKPTGGADKNGGSQAVLVTFQKILDPASVVRESEYARTTEGQALLDRIEGYATRLAQGGTTLTDAEMQGMVDTARQMFEGMRAWNQGTRQRIESQIKEYQLNPAGVFDDVLTDKPADTPTAKPTGRFNPVTGKVETVP